MHVPRKAVDRYVRLGSFSAAMLRIAPCVRYGQPRVVMQKESRILLTQPPRAYIAFSPKGDGFQRWEAFAFRSDAVSIIQLCEKQRI